MKLIYKNPIKIRGYYIWNANTKFLSVQELKDKLNSDINDKKLLEKLVKKFGSKLFFDSGNENSNKFFSWFSRIKEWDNQKNVKAKYSIRPKKYERDENGNMIDLFDFSENLGKESKLKIDFEFDSFETILEMDSVNIKPYNKNLKLYKKYTKSEKYLEQTNEIKKLASKIIGTEKNYFMQARRIFDWILDNISYKYPPEKRGVIPTLKKRCGDCGEFNHLFITLCRSLGIPARAILGMWAVPKIKDGYHAWAEFYLEGIGWIPVDSSIAEGLKNKNDKGFIKFMKKVKNPMNPNYYFGNLDRNRIIFSKGENIPLVNCPKRLSKFEMMEKCESLFMQPTSVYPFVDGSEKGIFIVDITSEINIL
ncbi:MAG: transglutaminase-like domain-containing protein [Nanoarchaeota archaeon]|nr:transglutaminase-like domain-containing protein [Nanoarchaeota archaeon]